MAPKKDKLHRHKSSKVYAVRPASPEATRKGIDRRHSDQKAAKVLGVEAVVVDRGQYRPQQSPEEALLRKEPLTLELPKRDVRELLHDISERPSAESQRQREDVILDDVRFHGALETDPQQRSGFDPAELLRSDFNAIDIDSNDDGSIEDAPQRPQSLVSNPFDLGTSSKNSSIMEETDGLSHGSSTRSNRNPFETPRNSTPRTEPRPSSSIYEPDPRSMSTSSIADSWNQDAASITGINEVFSNFVDIDALRQIEWTKVPGKFMPSPQERDVLITIRKTMARLSALNLLTRDIQDGTGLPVHNFDIPREIYELPDSSAFKHVRDVASKFASKFRFEQLCKDYDQWAHDNGMDSLATLAMNDSYRQYTEGWQKVFNEYGPWAWNLPDGGQLQVGKAE